MNESPNTVLSKMSDDEVHSLVSRLTLYALKKMHKLSWRGVCFRKSNGEIASVRGVGPGDVVNDVILSAIEGHRKWNRERYPSLQGFLVSIIDSHINHLVTSADNKHTRERVSVVPTQTNEFNLESNSKRPEEKSPLTLLMAKEEKEIFRKTAFEAVNGDQVLTPLLECLLLDFTRTKIAEYLEISTDAVSAARKRLDRTLSKAIGKLVRSQSS